MSNYAIQLADSGYASNASITAIGALTRFGATFKVRGEKLINPTGSDGILSVGPGLLFLGTFAGLIYLELDGGGTGLVATTTVAKASLDAAKYYTVRVYWDPGASPKQSIELYDDTNSLVISGTANNATAYVPASAVYLNLYAGGYSGIAGLYDWLGIYDGAPPAGAPVAPTNGDSGIVLNFQCDENSSPDALVDAVSGTTQLAITGTHSWTLLSGGGGGDTEDNHVSDRAMNRAMNRGMSNA